MITEKGAYEAVVVLTGGRIRAGKFLNSLIKATRDRGTRNIVLNIVSTLPRPKYFEALRDLIQNNISYALTVKYSGSSVDDLRRLINERGIREVYVDSPSGEFIRMLSAFNIQPVDIGFRGDER